MPVSADGRGWEFGTHLAATLGFDLLAFLRADLRVSVPPIFKYHSAPNGRGENRAFTVSRSVTRRSSSAGTADFASSDAASAISWAAFRRTMSRTVSGCQPAAGAFPDK